MDIVFFFYQFAGIFKLNTANINNMKLFMQADLQNIIDLGQRYHPNTNNVVI